ncbi:MAG TPA: hypothetical protein VNF49_12960 [Candidatus Binataceae bacterium]|nr:hypothetical protein [Candidatus Binataceae bacterium]
MDFEPDDLIPHGVGAIALGNREKLAQPAMGILGLRPRGRIFAWLRVGARRFDRLFWGGVFFVHGDIIAHPSPACARRRGAPHLSAGAPLESAARVQRGEGMRWGGGRSPANRALKQKKRLRSVALNRLM